jgi:hypothetical protein
MHTITLSIDESRWSALETLARAQGSQSVEGFVAQQLDQLIAARQPLAPDVHEHLQASIHENRGLLKRLAQ